MFDCFIKFGDDMKGEATAKGHEKEVQATSYTWAASNPNNVGSGTGGSGTGRVSFSTFTFTAPVGAHSPLAMQFCAQGKVFKEVKVFLRKVTGDDKAGPQDFQIYTLGQVMINGVRQHGAKEDNEPHEIIELSFGTIKSEYKPQSTTGSLGAPVSGSWNLTNNTSSV
jgi:type VI secretion system secreted protein Hcp